MSQQQPSNPPPPGGGGVARPETDMDRVWEEAGKSLVGEKALQRVVEHQKNVLSTVATVGTLLTGLGAVTAAVTLDRTTYTLRGVPLVPAGALIAASLASAAVMVALVIRRPRFFDLNPNEHKQVADWFNKEVTRGQRPTQVASWLMITAAAVAALTALVSGIVVLADPAATPVNHATLSVTQGKEVTAHLGGTIHGVDEGQAVQVVVMALPPTAAETPTLLTLIAYPDEDGTVTFDNDISPVPAENSLRATITIYTDPPGSQEAEEVETFVLPDDAPPPDG